MFFSPLFISLLVLGDGEMEGFFLHSAPLVLLSLYFPSVEVTIHESSFHASRRALCILYNKYVKEIIAGCVKEKNAHGLFWSFVGFCERT